MRMMWIWIWIRTVGMDMDMDMSYQFYWLPGARRPITILYIAQLSSSLTAGAYPYAYEPPEIERPLDIFSGSPTPRCVLILILIGSENRAAFAAGEQRGGEQR